MLVGIPVRVRHSCDNGKGNSDVEDMNGDHGFENNPGKTIMAGAKQIDSAKYSSDANVDRIAILDAGAQYGKVIDRRVRELHVLSDLLPLQSTTARLLINAGYKGVIISGGPQYVGSEEAPKFDQEVLACGIPVLGICYGMQLITHALGGVVEQGRTRHDGSYEVQLDGICPLFSDITPLRQTVLLTHGDLCTKPAPGFRVVAQTVDSNCISAVGDDSRRLYGVQFHPEVDLTTAGQQMLRNFVVRVCGCLPTYTISSRRVHCLDQICQEVGPKRRVLMLLSGGVDSTVCGALLVKAIGGDRIVAVHIDNGFMRMNESDQVCKSLAQLGLNVHVVKADRLFADSTLYDCELANSSARLAAMNSADKSPPTHGCVDAELHSSCNMDTDDGVLPHYSHSPNYVAVRITNPEQMTPLCSTVAPENKRKIIGDTFIRCIKRFCTEQRLQLNDMCLAQGTLRPDLIESASGLASGNANVIKTHHNDSPLVRLFRGQGMVVEPLKDFHKDEVRRLGEELGLPRDFVERHPFPGPGLSVRIICAQQPYRPSDFTTVQALLRTFAEYGRLVTGALGSVDPSSRAPHSLLCRLEQTLSEEELAKLRTWSASWDLAAHLLPIRSVGVQGDCRTYSYVAVLSSDLPLTAVDWPQMSSVAKMLTRLSRSINRVCYVYGERLQCGVEDITPTLLRRGTISQLRRADYVAHQTLLRHDCMRRISQMPVVLLPVHFDRPLAPHSVMQPSTQRSIALRPFVTQDFMTGVAALPGRHISLDCVREMFDQILQQVPNISRVLYDITDKPPATTEWE